MPTLLIKILSTLSTQIVSKLLTLISILLF